MRISYGSLENSLGHWDKVAENWALVPVVLSQDVVKGVEIPSTVWMHPPMA